MLNLVVVGFGNMGSKHVSSVIQSSDVNLIGIVDPHIYSKQTPKDIETFTSINEIVDKKSIDGMIIASTTDSHIEVINSLLQYDIPLLVEKPLSTNLVEVEQIINICKFKKKVFQVGFVELFNGVMNELKKIDISDFEEIEIVRTSPLPDLSRNLENVLYDISIHDIAVLDFLYDLDNFEIKNTSLNYLNNKASEASIKVKYKNVEINFFSSTNYHESNRFWRLKNADDVFTINFLNKSIKINNQIKQLEEELTPLDLQLKKFVERIHNKDININHLNSIYRVHNFINNLH